MPSTRTCDSTLIALHNLVTYYWVHPRILSNWTRPNLLVRVAKFGAVWRNGQVKRSAQKRSWRLRKEVLQRRGSTSNDSSGQVSRYRNFHPNRKLDTREHSFIGRCEAAAFVQTAVHLFNTSLHLLFDVSKAVTRFDLSTRVANELEITLPLTGKYLKFHYIKSNSCNL